MPHRGLGNPIQFLNLSSFYFLRLIGRLKSNQKCKLNAVDFALINHIVWVV